MNNYYHTIQGEIQRTSTNFKGGYDDENCSVVLVELEQGYYIKGKYYGYAVGIETYARNYVEEWVETPTLFRTKRKAVENFDEQCLFNCVEWDREEDSVNA
jgi:hypothetical protein